MLCTGEFQVFAEVREKCLKIRFLQKDFEPYFT